MEEDGERDLGGNEREEFTGKQVEEKKIHEIFEAKKKKATHKKEGLKVRRKS